MHLLILFLSNSSPLWLNVCIIQVCNWKLVDFIWVTILISVHWLFFLWCCPHLVLNNFQVFWKTNGQALLQQFWNTFFHHERICVYVSWLFIKVLPFLSLLPWQNNWNICLVQLTTDRRIATYNEQGGVKHCFHFFMQAYFVTHFKANLILINGSESSRNWFVKQNLYSITELEFNTRNCCEWVDHYCNTDFLSYRILSSDTMKLSYMWWDLLLLIWNDFTYLS